MKKIIIPNITGDEIPIENIKKRDKILVKDRSNNILGIVAIIEDGSGDDYFKIIQFNGKHSDQHSKTLNQLMILYNNYNFYLLEE